MSFLELLVAMLILVIVVIAVLQLFDKDVEVRKQQDQIAETQQNLRAAMELISRDVRGASACGTIPSEYNLPKGGKIPTQIALPLAVVWMPSVGPYASTASLVAGDNTRPDGLGLMRCVGNGIVDVAGSPSSFTVGSKIQLKEPLGLQPTDDASEESDSHRFILFWTEPDTASSPALMPSYITARIMKVDPPKGGRGSVTAESITLGPPIQPTNDQYATFGKHWDFQNALSMKGKIANFDPASPPVGAKWKAALVEWVEYVVDKWGNNKLPHQYSDTSNEGSVEHPLLIRRVNPYNDGGTIKPDFDIIGHDIENMQVVWIWDPDGDPSVSTYDTLPGLNIEYQAGDPSKNAAAPAAPLTTTRGVRDIKDLAPDTILWKQPFDFTTCTVPWCDPTSGAATPIAIRKVRVTLLARTRDRDFAQQKSANALGFPSIENPPDSPDYFQGSPAIPRGPAAPPLFLSAYKRRVATSEIAIRNYLPAGLN